VVSEGSMLALPQKPEQSTALFGAREGLGHNGPLKLEVSAFAFRVQSTYNLL